jgi:hypothetical protein
MSRPFALFNAGQQSVASTQQSPYSEHVESQQQLGTLLDASGNTHNPHEFEHECDAGADTPH